MNIGGNPYTSRIGLGELGSTFLPNPVPYAILMPEGENTGPFPLCIVLHGGGGSRQSLVDCAKLFEGWWSDGSLPPMVLASPSAGMSYYVSDPLTSEDWDRFIVDAFLPHLRSTCNVRSDRNSTVISGVSMGGYGALKTAFNYLDRFAAVASMEGVLEPGLHDSQVPARNRLHHASGGPSRLIGPARDGALFEANNPANRALQNAARIRESGLAIYVESGDDDFINVHDGSEFLHRLLWQLDISHEYRLTRGTDHVGPTLVPRMREMYVWLGAVLAALAGPENPEFLVLPGGTISPSSRECVRLLRAQMEPAREEAAASDPTTRRRYGKIPGAITT